MSKSRFLLVLLVFGGCRVGESAVTAPIRPPRLLVTNDDGIDAPGLGALVGELAKVGEVVVVAPRQNCSGSSHSGHPELPAAIRPFDQPVFIGGSMGTASYVLAGVEGNDRLSFSSACHGAGRRMSRHQARRTFGGRQVVDDLAERGILIRSPSLRGVAGEAPDAYKDVVEVAGAAERIGLATRVARLEPLICVKG